MSLWFILVPCLPLPTQCSTWQLSYHETSVQLDIFQAPKPGRPATYPVHPQPVPGQGAAPFPSEICAFVFAMVFCWVLQATKVLLNAARFSILRNMKNTKANLSSWKINNFLFCIYFQLSFTTPMSNLPLASVLFSKKAV